MDYSNKTKIVIFPVVISLIGALGILFILNKPESKMGSSIINSQESPNDKNVKSRQANVVDPIPDAASRITKKPFGIYVTPKNSSVSPERFTGYHTGVDLETFADEQNKDVPVKVFCDGKLLEKLDAKGYGGVAVELCDLDGRQVTIIYGHMNLSSIGPKVGDQLRAGEELGILGRGYSGETDNERKHLHFGIHKGSSINILGYVPARWQLIDWIDGSDYLQ